MQSFTLYFCIVKHNNKLNHENNFMVTITETDTSHA